MKIILFSIDLKMRSYILHLLRNKYFFVIFFVFAPIFLSNCSDKFIEVSKIYGIWVTEPNFKPKIEIEIPRLSEDEIKKDKRRNPALKDAFFQKDIIVKVNNKVFSNARYGFLTNFNDGISLKFAWGFVENDYQHSQYVEGIYFKDPKNGESGLIGYYYHFATLPNEEVVFDRYKNIKLIKKDN